MGVENDRARMYKKEREVASPMVWGERQRSKSNVFTSTRKNDRFLGI